MQALKGQSNIDFVRLGKPALILSLALILTATTLLATRGLQFGIDFTGGILIDVQYQRAPDLNAVRDTLHDGGFEDAVVQNFGSARDVLIRLQPREDADNDAVARQALQALSGMEGHAPQLQRQEFVGPQVGDDLAEDGFLAVLFALIGILIYVALRFEYRFAASAVIALVHDVVIALGIFSWLQWEFDLSVLAAALAVIGYSLNDTIVLYDRVRENFRRMRRATPREVINTSINQVLSRTIVTSLTTLVVLLALFFLGGDVIHSFAFMLILGVVIGTYSSIFIASRLVLVMGVSKLDLMPPKQEADAEEHP